MKILGVAGLGVVRLRLGLNAACCELYFHHDSHSVIKLALKAALPY